MSVLQPPPTTAQMKLIANLCEWPEQRLLLCFDAALRPAGGEAEIVLQVAGPISTHRKEPVGVAFHTKVLQQSGLYGERLLLRVPAAKLPPSRCGGGAPAALPGDALHQRCSPCPAPPCCSWCAR